ncbi:MAG: hypothetical protein AAGI01_05500 [Myxococcota bacterium]
MDVGIPEIKRRMTAWDQHSALLQSPLNYQVKSSKATSCVFYFERESPTILLPEPEFTVRATWQDRPDGSAKMTWTLLEGSPKSLTSTWVFTPTSGGTAVTHTTRVVLPINPPAFVLGDQGAALKQAVARFKRLVGAARMLAEVP